MFVGLTSLSFFSCHDDRLKFLESYNALWITRCRPENRHKCLVDTMWAEIYAGTGYLVPLDREAYMPATSSCFSNPADVPPVIGNRNVAQPAQYGYLHCFSYPADVPPGTRTRNAAQPAQYGYLHCFSYPVDVPPDCAGW
jgi:hypothetical protein